MPTYLFIMIGLLWICTLVITYILGKSNGRLECLNELEEEFREEVRKDMERWLNHTE